MTATRKPTVVLAAAAQALVARPNAKTSLRGSRRASATNTNSPVIASPVTAIPVKPVPASAESKDGVLRPSRVKGNRVGKSSRSTKTARKPQIVEDKENTARSQEQPEEEAPRTVKAKTPRPVVLTAAERAALKNITDLVTWIEFEGRGTQRLPTRQEVEDFVRERPEEMQQEYRERFNL